MNPWIQWLNHVDVQILRVAPWVNKFKKNLLDPHCVPGTTLRNLGADMT